MLVLNLDKIMTEIRADIEEIVDELIKKVPEKELLEEMGEEDVEIGKERKRKIGEEKVEERSSGSDDEDFLSKEAFELM